MAHIHSKSVLPEDFFHKLFRGEEFLCHYVRFKSCVQMVKTFKKDKSLHSLSIFQITAAL